MMGKLCYIALIMCATVYEELYSLSQEPGGWRELTRKDEAVSGHFRNFGVLYNAKTETTCPPARTPPISCVTKYQWSDALHSDLPFIDSV
jgi:hypothetical protein